MIKNGIIYSNFSDYKFTMTRAEGVHVWDDQHNKLLDFTSGWNVTNLGWNHPEVNAAFIKQAHKNTYASMWTPDPIQEEYAAALLAAYPGMDTAIRTTGGTEANEVAVKLARVTTGRKQIIGFKDTYHGQLFAALAIGFRPEYVEPIGPLVPDFIQMDYPVSRDEPTTDSVTLDAFKAQLEALLATEQVAGIFIEAGIVTGWGACRIAVDGFVEAVRELTKKYGTMMIVDEVGTGFSRTGTLFGIDAYEVEPDIATFAKGITNGAGGLGAVLTRAELAEKTISDANYVSTFGWIPTACAAALETLRIHQRDKVWENVAVLGERFMADLRSGMPEGVRVRGRGFEVCVDFTTYAADGNAFAGKIEAYARERGLHIVAGGEGGLQLMPPCIITEKQLAKGTAILIDAVKNTSIVS